MVWSICINKLAQVKSVVRVQGSSVIEPNGTIPSECSTIFNDSPQSLKSLDLVGPEWEFEPDVGTCTRQT